MSCLYCQPEVFKCTCGREIEIEMDVTQPTTVACCVECGQDFVCEVVQQSCYFGCDYGYYVTVTKITEDVVAELHKDSSNICGVSF